MFKQILCVYNLNVVSNTFYANVGNFRNILMNFTLIFLFTFGIILTFAYHQIISNDIFINSFNINFFFAENKIKWKILLPN